MIGLQYVSQLQHEGVSMPIYSTEVPLRRVDWPGVTQFQAAFLELHFKESPILNMFSLKCLQEEKHSPDIYQVGMGFVWCGGRGFGGRQAGLECQLWDLKFPPMQGYDMHGVPCE